MRQLEEGLTESVETYYKLNSAKCPRFCSNACAQPSQFKFPRTNPMDYNYQMITIAEVPEYVRQAEKLLTAD